MKDQMLIDKMIMRDCKERHTNLRMVWIGYMKAYDMIPHSWILETLKMIRGADNIVEFLGKSMKGWIVNLTSAGEFLGNVRIKRGIFQGDSLSPPTLCCLPDTFNLNTKVS